MSRPNAITKIIVLDSNPISTVRNYYNNDDHWTLCRIRCRFIILQFIFLPSIIMKNNVLYVLDSSGAIACKMNYLLQYHTNTIYFDIGLYITTIILMHYNRYLSSSFKKLSVYTIFIVSIFMFTFYIIYTWKTYGSQYNGLIILNGTIQIILIILQNVLINYII